MTLQCHSQWDFLKKKHGGQVDIVDLISVNEPLYCLHVEYIFSRF